MIGGIAAGLIAPYVFNWVAEYPILIVLARALPARPGAAGPTRGGRIVVLGALAVTALILIASPIDLGSRETRVQLGHRRLSWS